jgi:hypothetical protein
VRYEERLAGRLEVEVEEEEGDDVVLVVVAKEPRSWSKASGTGCANLETNLVERKKAARGTENWWSGLNRPTPLSYLLKIRAKLTSTSTMYQVGFSCLLFGS